jgi:hypothetical protein
MLQHHPWGVKISECSFAKSHVSYSGYVISYQGVSTCPNKVKEVVE